MSDRVTIENVRAACENVNRRMQARGSVWTYRVERRYNYCALDPIREGATHTAVIVGTKREVYDYLRAMMRALDDSSEVTDG